MDEDVDFRLAGPLYVVAQREAVESRGGTVLVTDTDFLLKMDIPDGPRMAPALMLYTKREYAEQFVETRNDPALVVATFSKVGELLAHLENDSHRPWVILNRIPGRHDGKLCTGDDFADNLRRWMAGG